MPPQLEIEVLGEVSARLDGVEVTLGGPRQRAVLAMLVAAGPGRLVSVDRMIEDLWAGEPPPRALAALHAYVSRLRRAVEPDRGRRRPATVLLSVPPGYRLGLPVEAVDSWHFGSLVEQAAREADPARVVELLDRADRCWGGEPFAAYADEDWARPVVEALLERHATATELRATALLRTGGHEAVVAGLLDHVQRHPLREQGVELLATALYRQGRQADSLAALSRIRSRLAEELGVDPGPRLRALEAAVLAHADHLDGPAPPRPPAEAAPAVAESAFVGRDTELDRLRQAFAETAEAGRAGVVWVSGEAGIGKSALVDRFAELVHPATAVGRGRCPDVVGAPPGWPWVEALRSFGRSEPVVTTDAFTLGRTVVEQLATYAEGPVLVVLDDLHQADEETLQVLRQVLGSAHQSLLVVGTFRDDQVGPELGATLASVAERTRERMSLTGLDRPAAEALLARFGRRPLAARTTDDLVGRSGGNPLFLREIGQLVSAEGAGAGLSVPPAIRELLTRRIDRLPEPVVELLSRAAVLGRDVDLDLLVRLEKARGGLPEHDVLDALDAALVAGLLELPDPALLRFTHALTRDTLHERLPPLRRRRLHQDVLTLLERDHPGQTEALARHASAGLDARTAERAAVHLLAAAEASASIGVAGDVVRHTRAALQALDLLSTDPSRRLRVLRLLADGQAGSGDTAGARATRLEGVLLAERHGTAREVAEQLSWDTPTVWTIRELGAVDDELVARLEHAVATADRDDPALRARLLSSLVLETESSPLVARAEEAAAEATTLARETGDPRLLCQALNASYLVTSPPRPPSGQRTIGEELLAASRGAGLVGYEAVAHHILFGAAAGDGDLASAEAQVAQAVRCAAAGQLPGLLGVSALFGGVRRLVTGDLAGATAAYDAIIRGMTAAGDANAAGLAILVRFTLAHAAGDTSGLRTELEQALDAPQVPFRDLLIRALLDAGAVEEARALLPSTQPLVAAYLWDLFTAVRAENAAELGDVEQCRVTYDALRPFAGRFAGLSSGSMTLPPVDLFLGRTAAALGRRADAVRHLQAACDLAARYGNTLWAQRAEALLR